MSNDREIDTMNTSFIDLICCALGSMLMLMLFVACLVRTTVGHTSRSSSDRGGGKKGGQEAGVDEGYEASPPEPLIASLEWSGLAKYPLQLVAYPPRFSKDELVTQGEVQLTAANGLARLEGGDTYFGFFDRKPAGADRWQLQLIVPRGRSAAADAQFRSNVKNKGEKLTGAKAPSHTRHWRFEVVYPHGPDGSAKNGPAIALAEAFESAPKFRLRVSSGETAWAEAGQVPLPGPTGEPKPGPPLREFPTAKERRPTPLTPEAIQAILGGQEGKPSLRVKKPVGEVPPFLQKRVEADGQVRGVRADWVAGFGPPAGERDVEFGKLWLTIILPELVLAAAHPPQTPAEQHQEALRIARVIDVELKKVNQKLFKARSVTLGWADVVGGAAAEAVPGSGALLGRVREYAALYVGTDPKEGGPITVHLKVEAYFTKESQTWVTKEGAQTAPLQPKGKVVFQPPNP
jgi:hypothetical protein